MKLIKHEKVNSCMTDPLANLSVIGCFQIAEETVTELMGKLKIDGITVKKAYNAVWVFAKSKLKVFGNIAWNEQYTVVGMIPVNISSFIFSPLYSVHNLLMVHQSHLLNSTLEQFK